MFGFAVVVGLMFAFTVFIGGVEKVSEITFPILANISNYCLLLCAFVLLPLSLFKSTRTFSCWFFFMSSYVFGLCVWMFGLIVTYQLWGGGGLILGLIFGGVGVVPLGILASAIKGLWIVCSELIFGVLLVYGTRTFAIYLVNKIDFAMDQAARNSTDIDVLSNWEDQ